MASETIISDQTPEAALAKFRADLASLSPRDMVRKHVVTGSPFALNDEQYYELRRVVAEHFNLHITSVVLVGSCRLGFSLNPQHRFRSVTLASDFDIAVVSLERFDEYWGLVFRHADSNLDWTEKRRNQFLGSLFKGWIDPRGLPPAPSFEKAKQWASFFDELMRSRQFGARRIGARLYRSWDFLEFYQERSVRSCISVKAKEGKTK